MKSQRHLFNIPKDIAYFNCAYYAPLLKNARDSLYKGVDSKSRPWEQAPADFFEDAETVRRMSSHLFGGEPDGYAIVPASSYGISTAARIMESFLKKGDQIVVMDEEFPSVVLPLQRTARETETKIVSVPTPDDSNWTQAILSKLNPKVKLVAISTCHWTNGAAIDLLEIRNACDSINSCLLLDATQTLGAMPFSMDKVKPDFLVASGYKWLLCPYGFGVLYVDKKWRNQRPLEETWLARENAEDFAGLVNYSQTYRNGARRFDVGETCTPTILPGVIAAFEQLKKWQIENIAATILETNRIIGNKLEPLGFNLIAEDDRCPHILGALIPENYRGNLVNELKNNSVYISQRGNSIRFAPHLHINENDLDKLFTSLNNMM